MTVLLRIEGHDLPGARSAGARTTYADVRVGVQRGRETVELRRADEDAVRWELELDVVAGRDGRPDVRGPWVQGRPGDRFVYLVWGTVGPSGTFTMVRRAKLMFGEAPLPEPGGDGVVVARLALSAPDGSPVCASVRPPAVQWSSR